MRARIERWWHAVILRHRYYEDYTRARRYRACECGRRWPR